MEITIPYNYTPRNYQRGLFNCIPEGYKRGVAVWHRRSGKVWASENVRFNISSNSVSPSFMQTEFTSNVDERKISQMIDDHPLRKILTVDEVAETILFLVNASSHVNGMDIIMNAGVNII
ncbi:MAG: SDR family oxidoreductase [Smithella sp.]